ncbi:MAG: RNA-binding S4 domain-containing protein [Oscillospiraceae bacterium]|jgi:ribosome-associated protein|nr:RNA-binding S4 domain-containing protein [Oscillospiraceae bacterium]
MKVPVKLIQKPPVPIPVQSEFIRLDAFLKLANAVESGGQAKLDIQQGRVRVNGEACPLRGKKLRPGDVVRYAGENYLVTAGKVE